MSSVRSRGSDTIAQWIPAWQQVSEPVSDLQLTPYLTRLAVLANKLSQQAAEQREHANSGNGTSGADVIVSSRLPKGTLKALMSYYKQLALDKAGPVDPALKRTYLAFYAQLLEMKSSAPADLDALGSQAELLIVKFVAIVSKLAGPGSVGALGAQFVELLRALARKQGGTQVLDAQLASQHVKFTDATKPKSKKPVATGAPKGDVDVIVEQVGRVMLLSPTLLQRDMTREYSVTLEATALAIEQEAAALDTGKNPVLWKKDFSNETTWQEYAVSERHQLLALRQQFPSVTVPEGTPLPRLVPDNVRAYFALLLRRCIDADKSIPTLFAPKTLSLLQFVTLYWRISSRTYATCLLHAAATMFEAGEIDVAIVSDIYSYTTHLLSGSDAIAGLEWPKSDRALSMDAVNELRQATVYKVVEAMRLLFAKKTPKVGPYLQLLEETIPKIASFFGRAAAVSPAQVKQIKGAIVSGAELEYDRLAALIPRDSSLDVDHILQLVHAIVKVAERLQTKYRNPMFDQLPIAKLVCARQLHLLGSDFVPVWNYCMKQYEVRSEEPPFEQMLSLHDELLVLQDLYSQVSLDESFPFDPESLMFPYFQRWAATSAAMSRNWAKPAIEQDDNTPVDIEGGKMYSSAVQDLFSSFNSSISLVEKMHWQNQYHVAKLLTKTVEGIALTVDDWAAEVYSRFLQEIVPTATTKAKAKEMQEEQWLAFAKEATAQATATMRAARGTPQPEPFDFKRESGVKLNNIAAAYDLLHQMEAQLNSDAVSKRIELEERKNQRSKPRGKSYLFTLTIISASDVKLGDSSGLYITLVDQDTRKQLGKTRTAYFTSGTPTWNEPFELEVGTRPRLLKATLWGESEAPSHGMCGRVMVRLDPKQFAKHEYGMQIKWLDLESGSGKLQVMLSIDTQRDDIRFHFGKGLRFLKRIQDSMVGAVVTQFSSFIHTVLSRQTLRDVTGQGRITTSVQTSVSQLQKSFNSWLGKSLASDQVVQPTMTPDVIDNSLEPLYDYLNKNFATLAGILTPELRIEVLSRTWDVVLEALELLVLPPLAASRTTQTQLSSSEMEVVYTWLSSLRDFFYSDGAGPSLERLQSQSYQQIMAIPVYYDLPVAQLKLESEKVVKTSLQTIASNNVLMARQRTVMAHRNKSVIEHQAMQLRNAQRSLPRIDDVILRILRLRGEVAFIEQHLRFRERLVQREMTERALQGSLF